MMSSIGITGIVLIILVAILLFGPNKLPELGRAIGRTLREFKKGSKELLDDEDEGPSRKDDKSDKDVHMSQNSDSERKRDSDRLPD